MARYNLKSEPLDEIIKEFGIGLSLNDKDIYNTIKAKAVLNKFGIFRKGWVKSLSEGIKKIASSISIEKREKPIMYAHVKRKTRKNREKRKKIRCKY